MLAPSELLLPVCANFLRLLSELFAAGARSLPVESLLMPSELLSLSEGGWAAPEGCKEAVCLREIYLC